MTDLHAWITRQVDRAEGAARSAAQCTRAHRWEALNSLIVTVPDGGGAGPEIIESSFHAYDEALIHAAFHDPAATLRRCEADRRILARHLRDPDCLAWAACKGCGNDDWGLPNVDNINDCPELLDLAHAHGITDEILAGLDRPQPSEAKPVFGSRYANGGTLTPPITTSDVPEALRGRRWKP